MKKEYEASDWGWNGKENFRLDSLFLGTKDYRALYASKVIAFAHFKFDFDEEEEVLYCYEVQVVDEMRSKGVGKFMMQILELIGSTTSMKKMMVTVFKHNSRSIHFFKDVLKYTDDETSPRYCDPLEESEYCYEIMSKPLKAKKTDNGCAKAPDRRRARLRSILTYRLQWSQRVSVVALFTNFTHDTVQVVDEMRSKGVGKFMMQILELIGSTTSMKKMMVTVFKHNSRSIHFFKDVLKYTDDETSPRYCDPLEESEYCYEIMSKPLKAKKTDNGCAKAPDRRRARLRSILTYRLQWSQRVSVVTLFTNFTHDTMWLLMGGRWALDVVGRGGMWLRRGGRCWLHGSLSEIEVAQRPRSISHTRI
eukprot:sb/3465937/